VVRYHDIKTKVYRILDLTSLTVDEFEQLVPAKVRVAHVQCILGQKKLEIPFGKSFIPACWCRRQS
jgi:hypothetical protein